MIWILVVAWLAWVSLLLFINSKLSKAQQKPHEIPAHEAVDVIIAVRNEEANIQRCLRSINNQRWLPKYCRVIIVNDHSEDTTIARIEEVIPELPHLTIDIYNLLEAAGKKEAIKLALDKVSASVVVQIDGDCWMNHDYLGEIVRSIYPKNSKAVFGEIQLEAVSFFEKIQLYEGLNNQCTTEAFVNAQIPIMVSGGAMAISGNAISVYKESLNSEIASGDDVFFAHQLAQNSINYSYNAKAIVCSRAESTISDFIRQRVRWSSKTASYDWWLPKGIALAVFAISLVFLAFLVLIPFIQGVLWVIAFWVLKFLIEYSFHRYWFHLRNVPYPLYYALVLTLLHPIYVVFIGLRSLLIPKTIWKGREI